MLTPHSNIATVYSQNQDTNIINIVTNGFS